MHLDPTLAEKFRAFIGRDPHRSAPAREIVHIKAPNLPQFRFEWHPQTRKLYLVRLTAVPVVGEIMAFNIETYGDAHNAVLIWLRGYREGATPTIQKPHLQL